MTGKVGVGPTCQPLGIELVVIYTSVAIQGSVQMHMRIHSLYTNALQGS